MGMSEGRGCLYFHHSAHSTEKTGCQFPENWATRPNQPRGVAEEEGEDSTPESDRIGSEPSSAGCGMLHQALKLSLPTVLAC